MIFGTLNSNCEIEMSFSVTDVNFDCFCERAHKFLFMVFVYRVHREDYENKMSIAFLRRLDDFNFKMLRLAHNFLCEYEGAVEELINYLMPIRSDVNGICVELAFRYSMKKLKEWLKKDKLFIEEEVRKYKEKWGLN